MCTVNNFSHYAHKAWEYSHDALDASARFLGDGVDKIIKKINLKFEETDVEQKLQRAWSYVKNTKICDSDETTQAVKKAAFALLISLPTIFLFKDIVRHANFDYLTDLSLIGGAQQLLKSMVYIYVIMTLIDFALSYAPKEDAAEQATARE
ncbi:MAG: hypothetical protein H7A41_06920 [Chlamydiales bacterium]|nr:hypothetical protein [Chlamydiales bacterium]